MNNEKNITVSFTGHREYNNSHSEELCDCIRNLYGEGFRIFLCGMARGFDLAAGECVLRMRSELPELQLRCIIPFRGQERSSSKSDRERYNRLIEQASESVILAEGYHAWSYHQRNDYLVDNASAIVAYYNGTKGGTHYTLHRAVKQGLRIINICTLRLGELFQELN